MASNNQSEIDIINRQAAIAAADSVDYTGLAVEDVKKVTDEVVKELKQLPSAQPDPCSVCRWKDEHPWSVCEGCKAEGEQTTKKHSSVCTNIKDAVKDFNSCIDGKPCEECKAHVQLCDCGAGTICELLIEHNRALIDKIEQAFNS